MSFYMWEGTAWDCDLLTMLPDAPVSICCDIFYDARAKEYEFHICYVRLEKATTGRLLVIPKEFVEDIFDITLEELTKFMRGKYEADELECVEECEKKYLGRYGGLVVDEKK